MTTTTRPPLPEALQRAWDAADAHRGTPIPVGATVVCDVCDEDFTHRPDTGGMIFGSYAYCPGCMRRAMPDIEQFGETHFIRARCSPDQAFADFVRAYRGPHSCITLTGRSR